MMINPEVGVEVFKLGIIKLSVVVRYEQFGYPKPTNNGF